MKNSFAAPEGVIDLLDYIMILGLETDLPTYNRVLGQCTYWEGLYLCMVFLHNRDDKFEKARSIFNSYV